MSLNSVEILSRLVIERVADIAGPSSAAARALACADAGDHGEYPVFCRPAGRRDKAHLIVTAAENVLVPANVRGEGLKD